jgi:hypothetical protein
MSTCANGATNHANAPAAEMPGSIPDFQHPMDIEEVRLGPFMHSWHSMYSLAPSI